jgi:hypothetical protein
MTNAKNLAHLACGQKERADYRAQLPADRRKQPDTLVLETPEPLAAEE